MFPRATYSFLLSSVLLVGSLAAQEQPGVRLPQQKSAIPPAATFNPNKQSAPAAAPAAAEVVASEGQAEPISLPESMGTYESPDGAYQMKIPVLGELGGQVREFNQGVIFFDAFTTHVVVIDLPMDANMRWELSTANSPKDYLIGFFTNSILPQYRASGHDIQVESAKFLPGRYNGALLTYTLQDGGSFFNSRLAFLGESDVFPKAKRGHLLFIKNETLILISVELSEKVTERSLYKKTQAEEDEQLRNRLIELADSIIFKAPGEAAPVAAKP